MEWATFSYSFLAYLLHPTFWFTYLLEGQKLSPGNTPSPAKEGSSVRDQQVLATPGPAPLSRNSKQSFLVYLPLRQCQKGNDREEGKLEKTEVVGESLDSRPPRERFQDTYHCSHPDPFKVPFNHLLLKNTCPLQLVNCLCLSGSASHPVPIQMLIFLFFFFNTGSHSVAVVGPELTM